VKVAVKHKRANSPSKRRCERRGHSTMISESLDGVAQLGVHSILARDLRRGIGGIFDTRYHYISSNIRPQLRNRAAPIRRRAHAWRRHHPLSLHSQQKFAAAQALSRAFLEACRDARFLVWTRYRLCFHLLFVCEAAVVGADMFCAVSRSAGFPLSGSTLRGRRRRVVLVERMLEPGHTARKVASKSRSPPAPLSSMTALRYTSGASRSR